MGKSRYKEPLDYKLSEFFSLKNRNQLPGNLKKQKNNQLNRYRNRVSCPAEVHSTQPVHHVNALPSKIAMSVVVRRKSRFEATSCTIQSSYTNDHRCLSIADNNTSKSLLESKISSPCNTSTCCSKNNCCCTISSVCSEERQKAEKNRMLVTEDDNSSLLNTDSSHCLNNCSLPDENTEQENSKLELSRRNKNVTADRKLLLNTRCCNNNIDYHVNNSSPDCSNDNVLILRNSICDNVNKNYCQHPMHLTSVKKELELYGRHMTSEDFLLARKSSLSEKSFDISSDLSFSSSESVLSVCHKQKCSQGFVLNISKDSFLSDVRLKMSALELFSYSADSLLQNTNSDSLLSDLFDKNSTRSSASKMEKCSFNFVEDANFSNNAIKNLDIDSDFEVGDEIDDDSSEGSDEDGNKNNNGRCGSSDKNSTVGCYSSFSHEDDLIRTDIREEWNSDYEDIYEEEYKELVSDKSIILSQDEE